MNQSSEDRYTQQLTQKRLGALEKDVGNLQQHQRTRESEKNAEALQKAMDKERSANEAYTKLIVAAGYAGFLTFWSKAGVVIPQPQHAWIGTLFLLSLVCYIGYEVYSSVARGFAVQMANDRLMKNQTPAGIDEFNESLTRFNRRAHKLWLFVLVPTVLLGFGSGLWVIGWYAYRAWATL